MKGNRHPGKLRMKSTDGFSLVELMVVMVIVAILATGVVFMFANPSAKVKNQSFTMLGEFNMARSEAVSKNTDTIITFLPGTVDAYRIWIDDNGTAGYQVGDTLLRYTQFPVEVQFYDKNATDGPNVNPEDGALLDMEDADTDDDGVEFDGLNECVFTSMGTATLANTGYVYIYYPASATEHVKMRAAPYALVVSPITGSVKIRRWTDAGAWSTK